MCDTPLILAVKAHNTSNPSDPITSILCPGLGTAVGRMPFLKCAIQMRKAYDVVINHSVLAINHPQDLSDCCTHHVEMTRVSPVLGENSCARILMCVYENRSGHRASLEADICFSQALF